MLDRELWQEAQAAGKEDERSGSWIINKALREYLNKGKKKRKPTAVKKVENAVMWIPLNSGEHGITAEDIKKYQRLYPAVNIESELRAMIGWTDANPAKRKTAAGIARFINSWLSRAQDKGGSGFVKSSAAQTTLSNIEGFLNE